MIIRPLNHEDLPALIDLAKQSGVGVTTLPNNQNRLASKIERAVQSFNQEQQVEPLYFFCMEHEQQIIGLCAIEANIGATEPWYNYRLGKVVHSSKACDQYAVFDTLNLSNDLTGSSELCSLFLLPDFRNGLNAKLLSKSRYLFLAEFPEQFSDNIIAEMRGVNYEDGQSPFWHSLGQRFFNLDFSSADYLIGTGDRLFVAELMPKHPIYVHMLSEDAQQVIGQPHEQTAPALHLLKTEGFRENHYVDIFDAGPVVSCRLSDIRAVRASKVLAISHIDKEIPINSATDALLVSNRQFKDYRCILVSLAQLTSSGLGLSQAQQQALNLTTDTVRACTVKPEIRL